MKEILGASAVGIALYSYIPYLRDIFRGKTKPHAFSWLVWGVLTGIGFFAQVQDGGGPGAWATGFTAIICLAVFILAFYRGEKNITKSDWFFLTTAFIVMIFWLLTDDALTAVILVTIINTVGFVPTFRKAFFKPFEETSITYALSSFKFFIAILALENFTVITVLYPASSVLTNGLFVVFLMIRRSQLSSQKLE